MKINVDEEGLELLQRTEEQEPLPEPKAHVVDKKPDWYKRGSARIKQEEKVKGRILLPSDIASVTTVVIKWFIAPLAYITGFSVLELAGWDMRGIAVLSLCIVVGVGVYLYNYLTLYPSDYLSVIFRIVLFTLGLALGVIFSAGF